MSSTVPPAGKGEEAFEPDTWDIPELMPEATAPATGRGLPRPPPHVPPPGLPLQRPNEAPGAAPTSGSGATSVKLPASAPRAAEPPLGSKVVQPPPLPRQRRTSTSPGVPAPPSSAISADPRKGQGPTAKEWSLLNPYADRAPSVERSAVKAPERTPEKPPEKAPDKTPPPAGTVRRPSPQGTAVGTRIPVQSGVGVAKPSVSNTERPQMTAVPPPAPHPGGDPGAPGVRPAAPSQTLMMPAVVPASGAQRQAPEEVWDVEEPPPTTVVAVPPSKPSSSRDVATSRAETQAAARETATRDAAARDAAARDAAARDAAARDAAAPAPRAAPPVDVPQVREAPAVTVPAQARAVEAPKPASRPLAAEPPPPQPPSRPLAAEPPPQPPSRPLAPEAPPKPPSQELKAAEAPKPPVPPLPPVQASPPSPPAAVEAAPKPPSRELKAVDAPLPRPPAKEAKVDAPAPAPELPSRGGARAPAIDAPKAAPALDAKTIEPPAFEPRATQPPPEDAGWLAPIIESGANLDDIERREASVLLDFDSALLPSAAEREQAVPGQNSGESICTFWLGDDCFGLDVQLVSEVLLIDDILPVPWAPAALLGLFNSRGRIVPVVNLGALLGLGSPAPAALAAAHASTALLIKADSLVAAAIIDRPGLVVQVKRGALTPTERGSAEPWVKGHLRLDERSHSAVTLLDPASLVQRFLDMSRFPDIRTCLGGGYRPARATSARNSEGEIS